MVGMRGFVAVALLAGAALGCSQGPMCGPHQVVVNGVCATPCEDLPDVICYADVVDAAGEAAVDVTAETGTDVTGDLARDAGCPDGGTSCGGACVDLSSDPNHCGSCANVCPGAANGTATCTAGACGVQCASGYHACSGACVNSVSVDHCGTSCSPCPASANAAVTCDGTTCGLVCDPGYVMAGSACDIAPPRQIAPMSTSTVTSQQPTLHWSLAQGTDGAQVDVCRDRACTMKVSFSATGSSAAPVTALTPGVWFWRVHGMIGSAVGTGTSPVWEFTVGHRTAPVDTSWGTTLDVNGDGYADLAVAAPQVMSNTGRVYVYMGGTGGLASRPAVTLTGPDGAGGWFGTSVASAGDVNGDGFADLVVGAPGSGTVASKGYVFLGGASGVSTTAATVVSAVVPTGSRFGTSVAGVGDVDGDGFGDVVVGAPATTNNAGAFFVYSGSVSGLDATASQSTAGTGAHGLGASVSGAGDVDGNGFADVIVGAEALNSMGGEAFVLLGSSMGLNVVSPIVLPNASNSTMSFFPVSGAGDVNGDGYADVIVGQVSDSSTSCCYSVSVSIYAGAQSGTSTSPAAQIGFTFGTGSGPAPWVASAGDANADGFGDVVIGAAGAYHDVGEAYVYNGGTGGVGTTASVTLASPAGAGGDFGSAVTAGDVNGDGFSDLVVGASGAVSGTGAAYSFAGSASGTQSTPVTSISGPDGPGGRFGSSLSD